MTRGQCLCFLPSVITVESLFNWFFTNQKHKIKNMLKFVIVYTGAVQYYLNVQACEGHGRFYF